MPGQRNAGSRTAPGPGGRRGNWQRGVQGRDRGISVKSGSKLTMSDNLSEGELKSTCKRYATGGKANAVPGV